MVIYVPNSIGAGSNAPTLFWFVLRAIVSYHACSTISLSGFMVDHSQAVLQAIRQSMALTSPLRPSPSLRLFNTGLAE